MEQVTAIEAHRKIEQAALAADGDTREVKAITPGEVVRQGDIYIHRVKADHPHGKAVESRQLAVGTNQNARHIAEAPAKIYEGTTAPEGVITRLLGPCIIADKPVRVSHPEHAHVTLPPGAYQITHQMDARTLERVRD